MKVQVEDVSPVEKRLSIEVEPGFIEKQLKDAYATLAQQVKVPGFRQGKVPRRLLEKHYRAEVEADVTKRVQLLSFYDAVRQENLLAIGEPHFSGGRLESQKPYAYVARVEVKPPVSPKDYKGLALTRVDASVPEERVVEQLERLRAGRASLSPVADRDVVEKGDVVKMDFEGTIEGSSFPGGTGKDVTFDVTEGPFSEGHVPGLEGTKLGTPKDIDFTFPADYHLDAVKGKTARFSVTPKAIQKRELPALDDALAVALGLKTLEELKGRIKSDLERAKKREADGQEREDLFKRLAEKNEIAVPNVMVQRGVDLMLESALGSMARSGMDLRSLNLDWEKLRGDLTPRAEAEVRGQLLLEAIAEAEGISVTDEDVEAKLVALAEEAGAPAAMVRKQYAQEDARTSLRARIRDEKVIGFLKANASYGS